MQLQILPRAKLSAPVLEQTTVSYGNDTLTELQLLLRSNMRLEMRRRSFSRYHRRNGTQQRSSCKLWLPKLKQHG